MKSLAVDEPVTRARVWTDWRWWVCASLLWICCTAIYFLTAPGRIDMIDGGQRHEVTESLIEIGVPAVRDPWYSGVPGRNGLRYGWYELGSPIAAIPFVLIGARLGHGSLEAKQFAFSMTTVPFAASTVALLFLIYGRLGCTRSRALGWSLIAAFGTMIWPYAGSSFDAVMQAFWTLLGIWAAIEAMTSKSLGWAAISGAAFAMLINVQEAYLVLPASLVVAAPFTIRTIRGRLTDSRLWVIAGGVCVGIGLLAAANVWRYGNPLSTGRDMSERIVPVFGNPLYGIVGLLFSPAKSIFLYSPTCVLGVIGLRRLIRRDGQLLPVAACIAIHIALISCFRFWGGEWAWGPRYLVATMPLVCIGLPFAQPVMSRRWLVPVICAAAIVVQILAVSVDHQRFYFARSLEPFFWLNESTMYKQSALFARPNELSIVASRREMKYMRALVPGPRPLSMTSSIFGPSPDDLRRGRMWLRQYLVFIAPRPWTLWSLEIGPELRPGDTDAMTAIGLWMAALSAVALAFCVVRWRSAPAKADEAEEEAGEDHLSAQANR